MSAKKSLVLRRGQTRTERGLSRTGAAVIPTYAQGLRTWVEIDGAAVRHNVRLFRALLGPGVKLWSVVKSNAYGHGLFTFAAEADRAGVDAFCVDSFVEARALRREGIKRSMLVLGATLPEFLPHAANSNIAISVSNFELLNAILAL